MTFLSLNNQSSLQKESKQNCTFLSEVQFVRASDISTYPILPSPASEEQIFSTFLLYLELSSGYYTFQLKSDLDYISSPNLDLRLFSNHKKSINKGSRIYEAALNEDLERV